MKIIFDYNRTLFDPDIDDIYPGVFQMLEMLSEDYELFLITRNEPSRRSRFEQLNIERFFKKILFVDEKTEDDFLSMVGKSKNVFVVGDSVSDEIKIGNTLGLVTVRVKQGKFAAELPTSFQEEAKISINKITELTKVLKAYEK